MSAKGLRSLRRRRLSRRLLIGLVGLCLIAVCAAGLVWLLETFRVYSPVYYEPKDIERERYETQRRSLDTKTGPGRP
jgi:hypothetical protein